jgi:hypothetical protein
MRFIENLAKFREATFALTMKFCLFTALIFAAMLQGVPYKPNDEFDIKLQYEFRQRVMNEGSTIHPDGSGASVRKTSSSMLPHLEIRLKPVKLQPEEVRLRIVDNRGTTVFSRKVKEGDVALINMGFTDDVKDRVSAHEYTASFLNADRKEMSRIVITVHEDGTFLVNNEKRGKF